MKNEFGVYGTLGVPSANNFPGGRSNAVTWVDTDGNFWLFGGYGYAATGAGLLNDLWMYDPRPANGHGWGVAAQPLIPASMEFPESTAQLARPVPPLSRQPHSCSGLDRHDWRICGSSAALASTQLEPTGNSTTSGNTIRLRTSGRGSRAAARCQARFWASSASSERVALRRRETSRRAVKSEQRGPTRRGISGCSAESGIRIQRERAISQRPLGIQPGNKRMDVDVWKPHRWRLRILWDPRCTVYGQLSRRARLLHLMDRR